MATEKPLPSNRRPFCAWCGRTLRPIMYLQRSKKLFSGTYGYQNCFCSKRHACIWAIANLIRLAEEGDVSWWMSHDFAKTSKMSLAQFVEFIRNSRGRPQT